TVGYDEEVVARLRDESRDAELPAAEALRTGESVWLESREDRDTRFPLLSALEPQAVSACAVPLAVGDRPLGALRFSFTEPRLFDEEERRFVQALAMSDVEPTSVLSDLNRALLAAGASGADGERFCTVIFGVMAPVPDGAVLTLAGGGHPHPLVRRADASVEEVAVGGSLLGVL